ncbi:MAG: hypothetical protein GY778_18925 [bacterium]|nr:hypothetical protein [bacterium]
MTPQGEPTRSCYFTVSDDCAATHCVKSADCSATYMVGYQEHSIPDRVVIDYPVIELQVEVTVLRDGIIVGQAVFHPIYEAIQPNGPDCPPTCLQAGDELIVD